MAKKWTPRPKRDQPDPADEGMVRGVRNDRMGGDPAVTTRIARRTMENVTKKERRG
jgi:hypothetical protein